ncbi:MAG: VWA domain-containing protein [bacterium]|nr:VWA domain-containing protein [bacterium]
MKRQQLRELILVGFFVLVTGVVMASVYHSRQISAIPVDPVTQNSSEIFATGEGPVRLSAHLVQDKIYAGGDGTVSLALTLYADDAPAGGNVPAQHVDMVIVLDQSGSMQGQKIEFARQAISTLLSGLSEEDRFAIVGYADGVWKYSNLEHVGNSKRSEFHSIVANLYPGGNTNLGAGLQEGIDTLLSAPKQGNIEKVILISDGLANRGIVDTNALGNIASIALQKEFAITSVGVGHDFNEQLMTAIADRGAGNYYYLANPQAFAEVFQKEFQASKNVVASGMEIRIPLPDGATLLSASGYPIDIEGHEAVVHPGDLLAGQSRKLFLTFQLPVDSKRNYELQRVRLNYQYQGLAYTRSLLKPFSIACIDNPEEALASVDRVEWEEKVVQEDFNALRERVAVDLKNGKKEAALEQLDEYQTRQQQLNTTIRSDKVAGHLDKEVGDLRDTIESTFSGSAPEVAKRQKANAKDLQYKGYLERRSK